MFPDHPDFAALKPFDDQESVMIRDIDGQPVVIGAGPLSVGVRSQGEGDRLYARMQGGGAGPGTLPYVRVYTQGV